MTNSVEHITRVELIARHLQRLQSTHALLSVKVASNNQYYNSMLINISDDKHHMLLDILHPASGHEAVMQNKAVIVSASYDGIELGFKSEVESVVTDDGKPAYRVAFPEKLIYKQRRTAFRASVGLEKLIPVEVKDKNNKRTKGQIVNVSSGGLCLQFDNREINGLEKAMVLPSCKFNISEQVIFEGPIEICNVYNDDVHRLIKLGVKFTGLTSSDERHIQKLVTKLERSMIKRTKER